MVIQVAMVAHLLLFVMGFEESGIPSRRRSIDLVPKSQTPLYLIGLTTCRNVCRMNECLDTYS